MTESRARLYEVTTPRRGGDEVAHMCTRLTVLSQFNSDYFNPPRYTHLDSCGFAAERA